MPVAGGAVGPLAPPIIGPALGAATTITAIGSFAIGESADVRGHSISIDAPPAQCSTVCPVSSGG